MTHCLADRYLGSLILLWKDHLLGRFDFLGHLSPLGLPPPLQRFLVFLLRFMCVVYMNMGLGARGSWKWKLDHLQLGVTGDSDLPDLGTWN